MIIKKKCILLVMLVSLFVGSSVMAVNACRCRDNCNSSDSSISGKLPGSEFKQLGEYRFKQTRHSIYLKTAWDNEYNHGVVVRVVAYDKRGNKYSDYGEEHEPFTLDKYGRPTRYVMISGKGKEWQIKNYVKEDGFDLCALEFRYQTSFDASNQFRAYWSPDYCSGYGYVSNIADTPSSTSMTAP